MDSQTNKQTNKNRQKHNLLGGSKYAYHTDQNKNLLLSNRLISEIAGETAQHLTY